jgi:hypothetical protein
MAVAVIVLDGAPLLVWAQNATWSPTTTGIDFNTGANWIGGVVPGSVTSTGTASFGTTVVTSPGISNNTTLNEFVFTNLAPVPPAAGYTIGLGFGGPVVTLTFNKGGVTNESSGAQGMAIGPEGILIFNNSTAGMNTVAGGSIVYSNRGGAIEFNSNSIAGDAATTIQNLSSGTITFTDSHAGSGEIDNDAGTVTFQAGSTADGFRLFNGVAGTSVGHVIFTGTSDAASASILNQLGSTVEFTGNSSGDAAAITNNGLFDISGLTNGGTTAGSIAGAGIFNLGAKNLTVGSNGLSTTVSGVIQDGGIAGGLAAHSPRSGPGR